MVPGALNVDREERVAAALHSLEMPLGKAELRAEFIQLRAKGLPYVRIAERLGVAKSTLANWNSQAGSGDRFGPGHGAGSPAGGILRP